MTTSFQQSGIRRFTQASSMMGCRIVEICAAATLYSSAAKLSGTRYFAALEFAHRIFNCRSCKGGGGARSFQALCGLREDLECTPRLLVGTPRRIRSSGRVVVGLKCAHFLLYPSKAAWMLFAAAEFSSRGVDNSHFATVSGVLCFAGCSPVEVPLVLFRQSFN